MKNVQRIDLGLTGYDELFMNDAERKENKLPRIYDVPISEIDDFPDHPFKVKVDEDMDQLVQSIKERGIITPVTLRPKDDGRYEIVSGHRRKKACELAGLDTVKAEVREMTRDEAIILMDHFMEACLRTIFDVPAGNNDDYDDDYDDDDCDEECETTQQNNSLEDSTKFLSQIVYHEAGHAVVSEILCPESITLVSAHNRGGESGGFTDYYNDHTPKEPMNRL